MVFCISASVLNHLEIFVSIYKAVKCRYSLSYNTFNTVNSKVATTSRPLLHKKLISVLKFSRYDKCIYFLYV